MTLPEQQADKRFLLFETQRDPNSDRKSHPLLSNKFCLIWSDRLVLVNIEDNEEFWNIDAFDLLVNETRRIRFRKTNKNLCYIYVHPLDNEYGFIAEGIFNDWHVNYVKFNWEFNEFQLVEHFEQKCRGVEILVDKMESSKFVLRRYQGGRNYTYQDCKLVKNKIEFGETYQTTKYFNLYFKNRLVYVDINHENFARVYNLITKKEETFKTDSSLLPKNVDLMSKCEWINDRLYNAVKFEGTQKQGIAWADLLTKRWNLMNFETSLEIHELQFVNDNLIIRANNFNEKNSDTKYLSRVKYFSIPMRKPNPLRYNAWLLVIQVMKNRGEEDPYAAAKEFLPLNSDLRSPWFKDEGTQIGEKQMKIKKN